MKQCECGSYAMNIEGQNGTHCDVCHWRVIAERLRAALEFLLHVAEQAGRDIWAW